MPSLGAILAAILEVLGLAQSIKSAVDSLRGSSDQTAKENVPFTIETNVALIDSNVRDPAHGLAAIITAIQSVRLDTTSPHIGTITDVLDAIALLTPVTLPTTPPPGYGGADAPTVWAYVIPVGQMCALD